MSKSERRVVWVTLKSGVRFPFIVTGPASDPHRIKLPQELILHSPTMDGEQFEAVYWTGVDVLKVEDA